MLRELQFETVKMLAETMEAIPPVREAVEERQGTPARGFDRG